VLHQTVAEHWPAFRERIEESGGLPKFVVDEEYLKCGIVEEDCLHLVCRSCGYSHVRNTGGESSSARHDLERPTELFATGSSHFPTDRGVDRVRVARVLGVDVAWAR
jgi:hypothetical protein